MFEKNTFENNVVPFKSKQEKTTLETLLQEQSRMRLSP